MNRKYHPDQVTAEAVAVAADDSVSAFVQIKGLSFSHHDMTTGAATFELKGLSRRHVNMRDVLLALGITEQEMEDAELCGSHEIEDLGEEIGQVVQQHDLLKLLKSRVKFVG